MSKQSKAFEQDDESDLFEEARLEARSARLKKLQPVKKAEQKLKEVDLAFENEPRHVVLYFVTGTPLGYCSRTTFSLENIPLNSIHLVSTV